VNKDYLFIYYLLHVQCYTPEELLTAFHIDPTAAVIGREDFERLSTALVQQAVEGCVTPTTSTSTSPPAWQGSTSLTLINKILNNKDGYNTCNSIQLPN
jgi:hypothetical protein